MKTIVSTFIVACIALMASCTSENKTEEQQNSNTQVQTTSPKEQASPQKETVNTNVPVMQDGAEGKEATLNGKPYTGEIWSTDNTSFVMTFKDGKSVGSKIFHKNKEVAILSENGMDKYFDENGVSMSVENFLEKYGTYLDEIGPQIESVFNK